MKTITVIGLMSGTSLDGLDLALCRFTKENGRWQFVVQAASCMPYPESWTERLKALPLCSGLELAQAHADYGRYLGEAVRQFQAACGLPADLVASHGHTIFHQPASGLTFQLGSGAAVAAACGIRTASDFRTTDVALGGQGAPLVPIGDALLFGDYDYCLNIGGIANISYNENGQRLAFDCCPANMVLNRLSETLGAAYDAGGAFARAGKLNEDVLQQLNALDYYKAAAPKSLGREWVETAVFPLFAASGLNVHDQLRTFTEHIAQQITASCKNAVQGKGLLATGGGAFNGFLIERIRALAPALPVTVPDEQTIKFKEAIIFGFLGALRTEGEINCLRSVTGASRNSIGGALYEGGSL